MVKRFIWCFSIAKGCLLNSSLKGKRGLAILNSQACRFKACEICLLPPKCSVHFQKICDFPLLFTQCLFSEGTDTLPRASFTCHCRYLPVNQSKLDKLEMILSELKLRNSLNWKKHALVSRDWNLHRQNKNFGVCANSTVNYKKVSVTWMDKA